MVEQAQGKVQEVAEQARDAASQAKDKAGNVVRRQVDERTSQTGIAIHSTAQDLRTVGQELRNQGKDTPARVADQLAERGEQFAGYLRTNDADRILHDVEDFARRQPWAVIVGGLALGFVASRFMKSSSERRYVSGTNGQPSGHRIDSSGMSHTSTRSTDEIRSSLQSGSPSEGISTGPSSTPAYAGSSTPPPAPTMPVTPTPTYQGSEGLASPGAARDGDAGAL